MFGSLAAQGQRGIGASFYYYASEHQRLIFVAAPDAIVAPMRCVRSSILLSSILVLSVSRLCAQTVADPALLAEINQIKAIDNHAHPKRALKEGENDPQN